MLNKQITTPGITVIHEENGKPGSDPDLDPEEKQEFNDVDAEKCGPVPERFLQVRFRFTGMKLPHFKIISAGPNIRIIQFKVFVFDIKKSACKVSIYEHFI
jgi:hypothetical protein